MAKKGQVLRILDWSTDDAWARYLRVYRVLNGDKKNLSPEEEEFARVVRRAKELVKII